MASPVHPHGPERTESSPGLSHSDTSASPHQEPVVIVAEPSPSSQKVSLTVEPLVQPVHSGQASPDSELGSSETVQ